MKKYIFDFKKIKDLKSFYDILETILNESYNESMKGRWGRNLSSFWDQYGYSKDQSFFSLKSYKKIKDPELKVHVDNWIEYVLERFKGSEEVDGWIIPNPNFDYEVID
jgi:RNAse (barnase) inhibitor barstar